MYRLARGALAVALLASAGSVCLSVLTARFPARRWWRWVVASGAAAFVALALATAVLAVGLLTRDFRLVYVDAHTDSQLPLYYALSALWAGPEGSLLFWTFLLAACDALFLVTARRLRRAFGSLAHAVLALLVSFFTGLVVVYANPFVTYRFPPEEGTGLRKVLQNVQMLFHPPTLYLGYLLFAVPFAVVLAALVSGEPIRDALRRSRPWLLAAWTFLTLGNLLGMMWAYVELGWGGYWMWDPVENASLIPWLSATALLHTLGLVRRRRVQPIWGAALVFLTFLLCLLGVALTRGGLVVSKHAFAPSLLARPLLAGVGVILVASAGPVVWRWRSLTSDTVRAFETRDWLLATTAATLSGFAVVVLLGTWWPAIDAIWGLISAPSEAVPTLTRTFYDRMAVPTAVILGGLLWGCTLAAGRARAGRLSALVLGLGGTGIALGLGGYVLALLKAPPAIARPVIVGVLLGMPGMTVLYLLGSSVWRLGRRIAGFTARRPRRLRAGALAVHLGAAGVLVALTLAEAFSQSQRIDLAPGESGDAAGVRVKFARRDIRQQTDHSAYVATVEVTRWGKVLTLSPELRAYYGREDLSAELAVHTGLREDLLVALTATEPGGRVALRVHRRPGVLWIWVGGGLMALGGFALMLPGGRSWRERESRNEE